MKLVQWRAVPRPSGARDADAQPLGSDRYRASVAISFIMTSMLVRTPYAVFTARRLLQTDLAATTKALVRNIRCACRLQIDAGCRSTELLQQLDNPRRMRERIRVALAFQKCGSPNFCGRLFAVIEKGARRSENVSALPQRSTIGRLCRSVSHTLALMTDNRVSAIARDALTG